METTGSESDEFKWSRVSDAARKNGLRDYEGARQGMSAASFVNGVAWLAAFLLPIGGLILVALEGPMTRSGDPFLVRHPLAVVGLLLVAIGFVQMMVIVMVANFVRATLAFQAEGGTFFAAFNGGIGEGLNPQVTASSPVSEFLAGPPVSPVPPVGPVVVPRNEIKGGTPSKHDGVPGWYSDPYGGIGHLRWWEGENWSETKTAQPEKD